MRAVRYWQVGRIGYSQALKLQKLVAGLHFPVEPNRKVNNSCKYPPNSSLDNSLSVNSSSINTSMENADTLLIVEHPPVYTTGIRTKIYTYEEAEKLRKLGAEFHRTNRGGLITFHGPGQLVVYPILNLKNFKPSVRWYVCQIEKTIINLCQNYGLDAVTSPDTGVWINDKKVCAIGIHGSRFITTHGLGLNCCTDLKWFEHIVPCGLEGKGVTSLSKELNRNVSLEEVVPKFLQSFSKVFDVTYTPFPSFLKDRILGQIENDEIVNEEQKI